MKVMHTVSPAAFEQFQTQNMDPALALIGTALTKLEKRKQVAARMLGFNVFEAIPFDKDLYSYHPQAGELLVAHHPTLKQHTVLLSSVNLVVFNTQGDVYTQTDSNQNDRPTICINDITKEMLKTLCCTPGLFQYLYKPTYINLGFDGVKVFDIGIQRLARRRIELDVTMACGTAFPLIIKASTDYGQKPTQNHVQLVETVCIECHHTAADKQTKFISTHTINTHMQGHSRAITKDMVLWEIKHISLASTQLFTRSLDEVRIAYAFLDAQHKNKTTGQRKQVSLTETIRCWSGRYISRDAVHLAMQIHPDVRGDLTNNNLSAKRVFPDYQRLLHILDAGTHRDYNIQTHNPFGLLDSFHYIESVDDEHTPVLSPRNVDSVEFMRSRQRDFFALRKTT